MTHHKIAVRTSRWTGWGRRMWYVNCLGCGSLRYRPTWDAAFALGIAHLKEVS